MSIPTVEQLAAELAPLAVAELILLPVPPPPPKPAVPKPVAPKPAAEGAAASAATAQPAPVAAAPAAPAVSAPAPAAPKPAPAPAAAVPPPPPPPPPKPVELCVFAEKGVHLDAHIRPDSIVTAAEIIRRHAFAMDTITGVDWMAQGLMEVVYDFFHPETGLRVALHCRVPRDQAEVPTISAVFPGANWHERETHDFFGIRFAGHPNLTPFLLPEDATYHPLRKDFSGAPAE